MRTVDLIQRKRNGEELSSEEITWLVDGYTKSQPLQLEKAEVLAVIDEMIERVGSF